MNTVLVFVVMTVFINTYNCCFLRRFQNVLWFYKVLFIPSYLLCALP
jgi:uncharacterized membrane protein